MPADFVVADLASVVSPESIVPVDPSFLSDLMGRGVVGTADAVVLPSTVDEVVALVRWSYANEVPLIPRGGGTGLAGAAVPFDSGVVVGFERLNRVRSFDPLLWRMEVEAGVTTAAVQQLARENGLRFPPDPGAAEQSQIGGNVACNAGGPHAFKYGVMRHWVMGLEAVVPPGELVRVGGPVRKDVAAYDLTGLLVGSEGTLGLVTAAWLRLIPAPELELPVVGVYAGIDEGVAAVERTLASGVVASAIEFMDGATLAIARPSSPVPLDEGAGFLVIAEADGDRAEAERGAKELAAALSEGAVSVHRPTAPAEVEALWRWRGGVSLPIRDVRGGAYSEDVAVPLDRLAELLHEIPELGRRHDVPALAFGHAGDGNVHATFLFSPDSPDEIVRADAACHALFDAALRLGGTVTGEHGIGRLKLGQLERQLGPGGYGLHLRVKDAFDPKGLLNPGKKR